MLWVMGMLSPGGIVIGLRELERDLYNIQMYWDVTAALTAALL